MQQPWLPPLRNGIIYRQDGRERQLILLSQLPYEQFVVSAVSAEASASFDSIVATLLRIRYDPVVAPIADTQDRRSVCFPRCYWSSDRHIPDYNPAIRISRQETEILPEEMYRMDLRGMASKHICWLGRRQCWITAATHAQRRVHDVYYKCKKFQVLRRRSDGATTEALQFTPETSRGALMKSRSPHAVGAMIVSPTLRGN